MLAALLASARELPFPSLFVQSRPNTAALLRLPYAQHVPSPDDNNEITGPPRLALKRAAASVPTGIVKATSVPLHHRRNIAPGFAPQPACAHACALKRGPHRRTVPCARVPGARRVP